MPHVQMSGLSPVLECCNTADCAPGPGEYARMLVLRTHCNASSNGSTGLHPFRLDTHAQSKSGHTTLNPSLIRGQGGSVTAWPLAYCAVPTIQYTEVLGPAVIARFRRERENIQGQIESRGECTNRTPSSTRPDTFSHAHAHAHFTTCAPLRCLIHPPSSP